MSIINLTPHAITLRTPNGKDITFPPDGTVARVEMEEDDAGFMPMKLYALEGDMIPMIRRVPGRVVGISCQPGNVYIVSSMVLDALRTALLRGEEFNGLYFKVNGQWAVVAPDTGATAIRNEKGHVVAVTRLVTL
jgi:hypothetical protein